MQMGFWRYESILRVKKWITLDNYDKIRKVLPVNLQFLNCSTKKIGRQEAVQVAGVQMGEKNRWKKNWHRLQMHT